MPACKHTRRKGREGMGCINNVLARMLAWGKGELDTKTLWR